MTAQNFAFSYSAFDLSLFDLGEGLRVLLDQGSDAWNIPLEGQGGGALRAGASATAVVNGSPTTTLRVVYTVDLDGNGSTESLFVAEDGLPGFIVSNLRLGQGFPSSGDYDVPVYAGVLGARVSGGTGGAGSAGRDRLIGAGGRDVFDGKGGADVLRGRGGKDRLDGGKGDDRLDGGAGKDRLDGGKGKAVIAGGRGDDTLLGGAGRDVFRFDKGDGKGDVIKDWNRRQDDIEIDGGAARFKQLAFRDLGDDMRVRYGKDAFIVENADRGDFRAADFDFV